MPQTSPMNWMLITIMTFLILNLLTIKSEYLIKKNIKPINLIKMKNIIWKW